MQSRPIRPEEQAAFTEALIKALKSPGGVPSK
jgi:hypothetical protein